MTIDKQAVLDALACSDVCRHFGHELRRSGRTWRSRDWQSFAIHDGDRKWSRHSQGIRGADALALVGHLAGLDLRREFARILELGAEIAGIDATKPITADERRAREQAHADRLADERRLAAESISRAISECTARWARLAADHPKGRAYLEGRGISSCVGDGSIVRFDRDGNPVLPLRDRDGQIRAQQTRIIEPRAGRRFDSAGKPGHAMFGDPRRICATSGPATVTEGFADFLSAVELYRDRLVLGAHSASGLAEIVELIAPRLAADGRGLILVAHDDPAGEREGLRAARTAIAAGMSYGDRCAETGGLELFDLGGHADLNDWLRAQQNKRGTR